MVFNPTASLLPHLSHDAWPTKTPLLSGSYATPVLSKLVSSVCIAAPVVSLPFAQDAVTSVASP